MDAHPLTLQARDLLSRQAVIDVELLDTLNAIYDQDVWAAAGCNSMHAYCVEMLAMSDDSIARRLNAADLLRRYPHPVRAMIASRTIHLTGLSLLHRVVDDHNAEAVFEEARGKSKKDIEAIVCRIKPKPQLQPYVRRIATGTTPGDPTFTHVARFLLTDATKAKLDEAIDLTLDSDLNAILERALATYVERKRVKQRRPIKEPDAKRRTGAEEPSDSSHAAEEGVASEAETSGNLAAAACDAAPIELPSDVPLTTGPRGLTRAVPASIARAVYIRDNGQCQYGGTGKKCLSPRNPQLHHDDPWARGGETTEANLKIFCRAHNLYQAKLDFGARDAA